MPGGLCAGTLQVFLWGISLDSLHMRCATSGTVTKSRSRKKASITTSVQKIRFENLITGISGLDRHANVSADV